MKLAITIRPLTAADLGDTVEFIKAADRWGVDYCWSYEAWGSDAATPLAYLAAQTKSIRLGTGIMQISARAPVMAAMTALTLNMLSEGRFVLGLGASGPQVVEGLHGVPYEAPLSRLREYVEVIRLALTGKRIDYTGDHFVLPLPGGEGKSLKLDLPAASNLPIYLATLGPRALEYTGAVADGWLGTSFSPEHAGAHLDHLRKGAAAAGRDMCELDLHAASHVVITDEVEAAINRRKQAVAFTLGAMGSQTTNFYNDAYCRAGYTDDAKAVQGLWLAGDRVAAARRVPDKLVSEFAAIGTTEMVKARFKQYAEAGIDTIYLHDEGGPLRDRLATLEAVCDIAANLD